MKKLLLCLGVCFFSLGATSAAWAHCGSCGVGDNKKDHPADCEAECKGAKDKKACKKKCKDNHKTP